MKGQIETKTTLDQNLTYTSLKTFIRKKSLFFFEPTVSAYTLFRN